MKSSVNNGPAPGLITVLGHSQYSLPALVARTGDVEDKLGRANPTTSNNLGKLLISLQFLITLENFMMQ